MRRPGLEDRCRIRPGLAGYRPSSSALTLPTTDLLLHLDARVGVTDAGDGTASAWADQSGNGGDYVQSTAPQRPDITTRASLDSQQVLHCDAASTEMMHRASALSSVPSAWTVYQVMDLIDTESGGGLGIMWDFSAGRIYGMVQSDEFRLSFGVALGSASTGAQVLRWTHDGSGSYDLHRNGSLVGSISGVAFPIGGSSGVGGNIHQGQSVGCYLAAHFVYAIDHDSTQAASVEAYITQEWGV